MSTPRHAGPQRTCVGCRRVDDSRRLVRLSLRGGDLVVAARLPSGRGAWLCPDTACLDQAVRRNALARALRTKITVNDDLRRRFTDVCEQREAVR